MYSLFFVEEEELELLNKFLETNIDVEYDDYYEVATFDALQLSLFVVFLLESPFDPAAEILAAQILGDVCIEEARLSFDNTRVFFVPYGGSEISAPADSPWLLFYLLEAGY
jgi:hypothetical protein